jgi:hypothetical protein
MNWVGSIGILAMAAGGDTGSCDLEAEEEELGFIVARECEEARFSLSLSREKSDLKEVATARGAKLELGREPILARISRPGQDIWHIECREFHKWKEAR